MEPHSSISPAIHSHYKPSDEQIQLAKALNLDPLIIFLAELRNIKGREAIFSYLYPSLEQLPSPFTMLDMRKATSMVHRAIVNKSEILVWGDYDVDGVTGTCLLVSFFKEIGVKTSYHIPNRLTDGYGLNFSQLQSLKESFSSESPLLITVDCGISNTKEIEFAKKLGFDVIITDHHEPGVEIPRADAVLNPKQSSCKFPSKNLAGVGVAFYLAAGIRAKCKEKNYFKGTLKEPNLKKFLDYVALGTIADIVPLTDTNRILVRAGFETLIAASKPGIEALLHSCDIHDQTITADDISFQMAPKINAAGRMGKAELAVSLLLSEDRKEAQSLAEQLNKLNRKRRKICQENLEITLNTPRNRLIINNTCIVHLGDFHVGVIGIVSSQVAEMLNAPAILLTDTIDHSGETIIKGSGRSIENINLFECLCECSDLLIQFGGHKMAAGLTLRKANLEAFKKRFTEVVENKLEKKIGREQQRVDVEMGMEKLFNKQLLHQFLLLEPFGEGNRRPFFCDQDPVICNTQLIGKASEHLKISFRGKYSNLEGVGFGLGAKSKQLTEKRNNKIIFTPMLNRFKKKSHWKVKIIDII